MEITYRSDITPNPDQIIELYNNAGLPRPTTDRERIKKMYDNSSLIVTAWDHEKLVGAARSLTDFCWSCYLADLAINQEYQDKGIGKKLIELTKEKISGQSMLLLLSVPTAMDYYPKVGFQKVENGFIIHRDKSM